MASLKEVKSRISSVRNIRKITSAMRMVASAKLHRAQRAIGNMLPYEKRLHEMLSGLLFSGDINDSPYARVHETKRIAIVAFSSNSSMAGAFNMNVMRSLNTLVDTKYGKLGRKNILIFPVGRKIYDMVSKAGYVPQGDFREMADKPDYQRAAALARQLMEMYRKEEIDGVELVYNHFKSMAVQVPTQETYLPIAPEEKERLEMAGKWKATTDFILEPSREELVATLLPKVLEMKIFAILLDSAAAEHAARTVAMQLATDNSDEMLDELTLLYNKSRQQAITNELLDIVSGQAAK